MTNGSTTRPTTSHVPKRSDAIAPASTTSAAPVVGVPTCLRLPRVGRVGDFRRVTARIDRTGCAPAFRIRSLSRRTRGATLLTIRHAVRRVAPYARLGPPGECPLDAGREPTDACLRRSHHDVACVEQTPQADEVRGSLQVATGCDLPRLRVPPAVEERDGSPSRGHRSRLWLNHARAAQRTGAVRDATCGLEREVVGGELRHEESVQRVLVREPRRCRVPCPSAVPAQSRIRSQHSSQRGSSVGC